MKKRILYVLLGVMLSFQGWGQSLDLGGGALVAPALNCERVFFTGTYAPAIFYEVWFSASGNTGTYSSLGIQAIANATPYYTASGYYYADFLDNFYSPIATTELSPKNILINKVTKGSISASQVICSGGDPLVFGSVSGTGDGTLTYRWESNTNITVPNWATIPSVTTETYDVPSGLVTKTQYRRFAISTLSGLACETVSSTNIITVTVNNVDGGTIAGAQTICSGSDPTATVSSVDGSGDGTISYRWELNTNLVTPSWSTIVGFTGTTYDPGVLIADAQYRRVTISTLSGVVCESISNVITKTVNTLPTATITAGSATTFCAGGSVTLTSSAGATYLWSTGATTQSILVSAAGSYSVTVTNVSGCSATSAATTVIVNALPTATITTGSTTTFCSGGSVTLTSSAGSSYSWSTGATTQSITVTTAGSYSVTVTNASGCSATSAATTVIVNALPTATITTGSTTTFCSGGSVTLTSSAGSSYSWSTGATTQSITVTTAGSYSVTVTNASGCSATSAATTVTVNALPAATITAGSATTFCSGGSVTLTSSAGSSYSWSNGATTQSVTITTAGSYSVTVTNASGCSATSASTNVIVNALPTATITAGGATTFCAGGSVTLTSSAGATYLWSTGATTQSILVSAAGSYSVTVTNASGCSATSAATTVTVNALPTATITAGSTTTFCAGGSVNLTSSAGATYLWSTGATTQSILVSAAGSYSVTVTNASGCSATSAATTVTVNTLPTITVTNPIAVCSPNTIDLTASAVTTGSTASLVYGYFTNAAATTALGTASAITTSGTYYIKGTDGNSCSSISPVVATINPLPTVTLVATKSKICLGESLTLTGVGATSYSWTGGVTNGTAFAPITTTTYTLTGTDINGCVNIASVTIPVNPLPTITQITSSANKLMVGSDLILNNSASNGVPPYSYIWNNSDPSVAGVNGFLNPTLTGLKVGFVDLKYYVIDGNGCKSLTSNVFNVEIIPALMKFEIPNAFIPTDMYMDNKFLKAAYNSSVKRVNYFRVFNRMGKLVYEIQNADPSAIKWDGTYNNVMLEPDGYMWIAEITGLGEVTFERKSGQFLLIK